MLTKFEGDNRTVTGILNFFLPGVKVQTKADSQGRCIPPCAAPKWKTVTLSGLGSLPSSGNAISEVSNDNTNTVWFPGTLNTANNHWRRGVSIHVDNIPQWRDVKFRIVLLNNSPNSPVGNEWWMGMVIGNFVSASTDCSVSYRWFLI